MKLGISEALNLAITRFETGDLKEAELICELIIQSDQSNAAALNLLGLISLEINQFIQAQAYFTKAIVFDPSVPDYYNNLGSLHHDQNHHGEAEKQYRKALEISPNHPEILTNLGDVLLHLNKHFEAVSVLSQALAFDADNAFSHTVLGDVYQEQQKFDEAELHYEQALKSDPNNIKALVNLGTCMEQQGELKRAAICFRKAVELNPLQAAAINNLGNILQKEGCYSESIECYKRALAIEPEFAPGYQNLGLALAEVRQTEEAVNCMRRAIAIKPDYIEAHCSLGDLMAEHGNVVEAATSFKAALEVNVLPGLKIRLATLLPVINESKESIEAIRQTLGNALNDLHHDKNLSLSHPVNEVRDASFYLSYHGINNRDLKIKLASLFERTCPSLLWRASHCALPRRASGRIKVGFISKYIYDHSIGKTTAGLVAKLPRDCFQVYAISVGPVRDDSISQFIKANADEVVVLKDSLEMARQQIALLELDILFYQDIGMEPFTYFLAFSRLARVQCTSFGHPDTTGIGNMDYFISSELFEVKNAQDHYSEKLFLLRDVGTLAYYYRPPLQNTIKHRSTYGLSEKNHLYLCPQTLFKFHPEFDQMMGDILRGDPRGQIILLEGNLPNLAILLRQRLQRSMPDVAHRVIFLPPQSQQDFINLIKIVDVMLDIPHFNGMNSTLEAFSVGTPVVTLPGQLQRTRHGYGMYRKMGINDCIAENKAHHVKISLRLANEPVFREEVRAKILAKNYLLYEDEHIVSEFSRFFQEALRCH